MLLQAHLPCNTENLPKIIWQSTYVSNNESLLCHHDNDSLTTLIKLSPPTVINSWIELQFQRTHENWITLGASTILYRNESKFLVPSKRGQSLLSLHVRGNCTFEHRVSAFYVYIYIYVGEQWKISTVYYSYNRVERVEVLSQLIILEEWGGKGQVFLLQRPNIL